MSNMMTMMPSSSSNEEVYDDITKTKIVESSDLLLSVDHQQQQQQQIKQPQLPQENIIDRNGMGSSSKKPVADVSDQSNTLQLDDNIKNNKANPISIINIDSNGHQNEKNHSHDNAKIDNHSTSIETTKKIISSNNKNDKHTNNSPTNTSKVQEPFTLNHRLFKYPVEGRIRNHNKKKSTQQRQNNNNNEVQRETNNDQQQQSNNNINQSLLATANPKESVSKTTPTITPTKGQQNAAAAVAASLIGYEPVYKESITYQVLQKFNKVDLAYKIEDHPFHQMMQQKIDIDENNNNDTTVGKNSRTTRSSSTMNHNNKNASLSPNLLDSQFGPYNNTISDLQQSNNNNNVNKQSIMIKNVYFRPNVFPQHDHQGLQLIHKQQHEQQIQQQQSAQQQQQQPQQPHQKVQMQQLYQHQPLQPPPQQEPLPQQQQQPSVVLKQQHQPTSFFNRKNNDDDSRISVRITHGPYQGQTGYLVNVIDGKFSVIQNDETKSTITINNSYVESIHKPRIRIAQKPPPPPLPCPPPPVRCPPPTPVYCSPPTPVQYPPPTPPLNYNPAPNIMTTSPPIGYSHDNMAYGNNNSYTHPNTNNNHPMGLSNSVAEYKKYVPIIPTGTQNTSKTKNVKKRKQAAVVAIEPIVELPPTKIRRKRRKRNIDGKLEQQNVVVPNERYSSPLSKYSSKATKAAVAIGYSPSFVSAGLQERAAVMPIQVSQPITTNTVAVPKKRRRRKIAISSTPYVAQPIGTTALLTKTTKSKAATAVAAFPPSVPWEPVTTKQVETTKLRRKRKQVVSVTNGQNIYDDGRTRTIGGRFQERKTVIPILESQIDIPKSTPPPSIVAKGSHTKVNSNNKSLLVSMKQTENAKQQQEGQSTSKAFTIEPVKMPAASLVVTKRSPDKNSIIRSVVTKPSESIIMPVLNIHTTIEKTDTASHVNNNETLILMKDTKVNHNNGRRNKKVVESSLHDTNNIVVIKKTLNEEGSSSSSKHHDVTNSRHEELKDIYDKAKKKLWEQAASLSERRDNTNSQQDAQQDATKKGEKDVVIVADTTTVVNNNNTSVSSESQSPSPNLLNTTTTAPSNDILLKAATTKSVDTPLKDEYQTTTTATATNNSGGNEKLMEEEKAIDTNEHHQHVVSDNKKSPGTTTSPSSIGILGTFKNLFLRR